MNVLKSEKKEYKQINFKDNNNYFLKNNFSSI